MRRGIAFLICGALATLALTFGDLAVDARAEAPPKLVVRQFYGPFGVESGDTVQLAAFNLLPNAHGRLTFTLLDAITGEHVDGNEFILGPRNGENFTMTITNPGLSLLALVRFEAGVKSDDRGPALASSLEVLGPAFETKLWDDFMGDWDCDA